MGTWCLKCQTSQIESKKQLRRLQLTSGISKEVQMVSMSKHRKTSTTTSSYSWTRKLDRSAGACKRKRNHPIHRLALIKDRWQPNMKRKVIIPTNLDTKGIKVSVMITIDIRKMAITATDRGHAALTIDTTIKTDITRIADTKRLSFSTGHPSTMKEGDPSMTQT